MVTDERIRWIPANMLSTCFPNVAKLRQDNLAFEGCHTGYTFVECKIQVEKTCAVSARGQETSKVRSLIARFSR